MTNQTETCHVLVLENDHANYRAIRRALEISHIHFQHDRTKQLNEAKTQLKRQQYDLVLISAHLSDAPILEAIPALLALTKGQPVLVIADDKNLSLAMIKAGAYDVIPQQNIGDAQLVAHILLNAKERHQHKQNSIDVAGQENYLAYYDQLTSLPNRALFFDRLNQALAQAKRHDHVFFLFFIRLTFNQQTVLSPTTHNTLISHVAEQLLGAVRSSDTVAHLNELEFAIILQRSNNMQAMEILADKLIKAIQQPIISGESTYQVGSNIGLVCSKSHGNTAEKLVKNAELAMHNARLHGLNKQQIYTSDLLTRQAEILDLVDTLRQALQQPTQHFQLHYQPRVELSSGEIQTVEALLRWYHPHLGNIPPEQFIPLAEQEGLIETIDEWVLHQACQQVAQWRPLQEDIKISVNLSAQSLKRPDFANNVILPLLTQYQLTGKNLEIDVPDSVLITGSNTTWQTFIALANLGVSIAIDSFGKHLLPLKELSIYPISTIKIEASFLCDHHSSDTEKALLKSIITLGKNLNMQVVAKSVETQAQLDYLTRFRCDAGQGFYWYKPMKQWLPSQPKRKVMKRSTSSSNKTAL